ncbi:sodium:solute symporter family transporter [Reinekea sp.]|jgi:Na+/proline symporter/signal transduction histidine kinase|uniref:hybrid sensor histidine kinase/response regulator n=1 Tax=Reinekea sp. TaxID=1970455 RepID=UPI003989D858
MFNLTFIIFISLLYIAILFGIALLGDKYPLSNKWHSWVYGLSLTIFCTSWTFYGSTLQFAEAGWFFSPSHVGTILLFAFGMTFWRKLIRVAKQENVTTISDFIASRYGHSRMVSMLAATICLIGIIPYVSLQLKAVSTSFNLVTGIEFQSDSWLSDSAIIVSLAMGGFAILFGTRHLDTSEHHPGMMLAIAFESIVKLIAFIVVAYWAVSQVGGGLGQVISDWRLAPEAEIMRSSFDNSYVYMTQVMLGVFGIFVLPRQFHVAVVEYRHDDDLKRARWLFPVYLLAINFLIAPLTIVGLKYFSTNPVDLEYLILKLPLSLERTDMAVLAFIGGLSAATSMVIVATVALSTMLSNEILLPILIRFGWWNADSNNLGRRVLQLRRIGIMIIVFAAFFYYRLIVAFEGLVSIGLISFAAASQFVPALVLGLFWSGVNRKGAIWGLSVGFITWFYTLLLPLFARAGILSTGFSDWLFSLQIMNPYSLFGLDGIDPVVHGLAWSLALNTLALLLGSAYGKESLRDRIQASRFVHSALAKGSNFSDRLITIGDLHLLIGKFVSKEKQHSLFENYVNPLNGRLLADDVADAEFLHSAERMLTSVLGAPASRLLFEKIEQKQGQNWRDVTSIVDEASQVLKFNRDLLNSALQSINQGISIVDRDLNIVAWNQTYQKMFTYPDDILSVGRPVEDLLNHNAFIGECGEGDPDLLVLKRLNHLTTGTPYKYERKRLDGTYLEIEGRPMDEGGYITVYTDVTARRIIEDQLRRSNEYLEETVNRRTEALQASNTELEKANKNKTRFLAAAGHDLVQPLNSAALFAASLQSKLRKLDTDSELVVLSHQIEQSLQSAENLLNELLEISKLDSDIIKPSQTKISFSELQHSLAAEFSLIAKARNVSLTIVPCSLYIKSDVRLLRRILQNLLSNAINYSHGGRVVMGVRRRGKTCRIDIIDTGPGLTEYQAKVIFDEFYRVAEIVSDEKGLGLGLAIVRRMADLLDHKLELESVPGKGSRFSVSVPITNAATAVKLQAPVEEFFEHSGRVLCLDNEQSIIDGMKSLVGEWGYIVDVALNEAAANLLIAEVKPDLVIIDYHLDNNVTGLNVLDRWKLSWLEKTPVIVITADYTEEVREATKARGFQLLKKPVRPMQLKSLIASILK